MRKPTGKPEAARKPGKPVSIPRALVEYILLGPTRDRRQVQDSPILADVWIAFAKQPGEPQEVLITPDWRQTAASVAVDVDEMIHQQRSEKDGKDETNIASLQGFIAARLYFEELLRVIIPTTFWWTNEQKNREMKSFLDPATSDARLDKVVEQLLTMVAHWSEPAQNTPLDKLPSSFDRYAALAGLILWSAHGAARKAVTPLSAAALAIHISRAAKPIRKELKNLLEAFREAASAQTESPQKPLVYQVSLNRRAELAIARSVGAVKGDAARGLFSINCKDIGWAVIDSGIQGDHLAFRDDKGNSRVMASFDFSRYRKIVNLDNRRIFAAGANPAKQTATIDSLLTSDLVSPPTAKDAAAMLTALAEDLTNKRPLHWEFVEPFVAIKIETPPKISDHGTHVAGIIGARQPEDGSAPGGTSEDYVNGMCPDIQLYDFRVLAESDDIKDTEFAIIAALQYIRYLNERQEYVTIHGANLSLSIPTDVHNFACGRTPVCQECERLVESGVVVVAAAGNLGYQNYQTKDGSYEGYAAFTITDPGNADCVITVGSTHRTSPHTYGVSFFSSRGPTGDGRQKPDLVAPGEKIRGPFRTGWDFLDGTSMAAPHVSGAAAMIMARYTEMIKQPRRIKRILCESATDLGRERSFQGNGMLDVLRALQSI